MKKKILSKKVIILLLIFISTGGLLSIYQLSISATSEKKTENSNEETLNYSIVKKSYMEGISYVEFPQIEGIEDKEKQGHINQLLKDRALYGGKTYDNENFVDFTNRNFEYNFKYRIGLVNDYIVSFIYYISWYGEWVQDTGRVERYVSDRCIGITINMMNGEEIRLIDLMAVDERLINSTDGSGEETDFDSAANPICHTFKDAFAIYSTPEEEDAYHYYSEQEVINKYLISPNSETLWYISKEKYIEFNFGDTGIDIPYAEITELIYSQYYPALEQEHKWIEDKKEKVNYDIDYKNNSLDDVYDIAYINYPQITGLNDKTKQKKINKLLKEKAIFIATAYPNTAFSDYYDPNIEYDINFRIGLANNYVLSVRFVITPYELGVLEDWGFPTRVGIHSSKYSCINIDMQSGEEIMLPDFMTIDERLFSKTDGTGRDSDYSTEKEPVFYKAKDAFMVYTSEKNKDENHIYSSEEVLNILNKPTNDICWFIDTHSNIVFHNKSGVYIPYTEMFDLIYPKYLDVIGK